MPEKCKKDHLHRSNKDIFLKMRLPPPSPFKFNTSIMEKYLSSLPTPRKLPSPPRRLPKSPPRSFKPPPSYEDVKMLFEPPPRDPEAEKEGLKMILIATLEEMRDRLPPESNQRRWFEAMLKTQE